MRCSTHKLILKKMLTQGNAVGGSVALRWSNGTKVEWKLSWIKNPLWFLCYHIQNLDTLDRNLQVTISLISVISSYIFTLNRQH